MFQPVITARSALNKVLRAVPVSAFDKKITLSNVRKLRATRDCWAASAPTYKTPYNQNRKLFHLIESQADQSQDAGPLPIWEGYSTVANYPRRSALGATRTSNQVRTKSDTGEFFTWLVMQRRPKVVVEIGAAFGVSGMHWLAGLEINTSGHLFSFEPNKPWANIARRNLSTIGDRFTLTVGTFENNLHVVDDVDGSVDIVFVDAIHTSEFVNAQVNMILERAAPGALILLDDIDFSADMVNCWTHLSRDKRFVAAFEFGRVGCLELPD